MELKYFRIIASLVALGTGILTRPAASQLSGDGFLFHAPTGTVTLQGGLNRPDASGDLFSTVTDLFTLERNDFNSLAVGSSLSYNVSEQIALGVSASYTARTTGSEYRDWVDQDDLPIEQQTNFLRVPLLATARVYLLPRGESIGTLAWVPAKYVPYVGVGAGAQWHRFRISGDMFDYDDPNLEIYNHEVESSGWAPAVQALAGIEVSLTPRFMVTGEASYIRSDAELGSSFGDFQDPINLSGFAATVGLSARI